MTKLQSIHKSLLLCLVAVITAVFFRSRGTHDLNTWLTWGRHAYEHGIVEGYAMDGNLYPPFAEVLLWLGYSLAMLVGITPVFMLKFSFLVFLLATTTLFYYWSQKNLPVTLYFYSAMLLTSLGLGYLDIYFAAPLLFALYRLQQGKLDQFVFFFVLACLIKFPPLMVAPFFLIYIIANFIRRQHLFEDIKVLCRKSCVPAAVLMVVVLFFFGRTLIVALLKMSNAGWLSAWALNFNWVVTRVYLQEGWGLAYPPWFEATVAIMSPVPDIAQTLARSLYQFFYMVTFAAFVLRKKAFENVLLFSMLASFSYFMFYTGVHENHLFLTSLLAMALYCANQNYLYMSLGVLLMSSLNMFVFYGVNGNEAGGLLFHPDMSSSSYSYWSDAPLLIAIGNVVYFLVLWFSIIVSGWHEMLECFRKK